MKYKIDDKVLIKSLDWYYKISKNGDMYCGTMQFMPYMSEFCGKTVTISNVNEEDNYYEIQEDNGENGWTDEMIEDFDNNFKKDMENEMLNIDGAEIALPKGYEFHDENGNVINAKKVILVEKPTQYPKTYAECCRVLDMEENINVHFGFIDADGNKIKSPSNYHCRTIIAFECLRKLFVCRDAYWKIAGKEMGLDKPWEPNWGSEYNKVEIYGIVIRRNGEVSKAELRLSSYRNPFVFPTEKLRDDFYNNFKSLMNECKMLLLL